MFIVGGLVLTVLILKLAEATGGLEFDGWGGAFGAAVVLLLTATGTDYLLPVVFPMQAQMAHMGQGLWLFLALELVAAILGLLVAWAVVPGAHVRSVFGLLVAAVLLVGFRYAGMALIPAVMRLGL